MKAKCQPGSEVRSIRPLGLAPPGSRLHNQDLFENTVLMGKATVCLVRDCQTVYDHALVIRPRWSRRQQATALHESLAFCEFSWSPVVCCRPPLAQNCRRARSFDTVSDDLPTKFIPCMISSVMPIKKMKAEGPKRSLPQCRGYVEFFPFFARLGVFARFNS